MLSATLIISTIVGSANPDMWSDMPFMMWNLGVFMGCIGIIVALLFWSRFEKMFRKVTRHLLLLSALIWVAGVVVYVWGYYHEDLGWYSVLPRAIVSSFKMFVVAHDLARVNSYLFSNDVYMAFFSMVHFAAGFITFMLILKMVGYRIKSWLGILLFNARGKKLHIFWGVNEASLLLAEDLYNRPNERVIFIHLMEDSNEDSYKKTTFNSIMDIITLSLDEIDRIGEMKALVDNCHNSPAALTEKEACHLFKSLRMRGIGRIVKQCREINFYFLSSNESQNILSAINLQKDQSIVRKKYSMFVHARKSVSNTLFNQYSQYVDQNFKVKIVDSAYISVARLKEEKEYLPVKCVDFDPLTGVVKSPFTSLIVGFGATGQEAFRFLYEFASFIDQGGNRSPFKCYAVDKDMGQIEGLVRSKMPKVTKDELCLVSTAVDSEKFWEQVHNLINKLNYVVIGLNDDDLGLSLAINIFKLALKMRKNPLPMKIMVRCYENADFSKMQVALTNLNESVKGHFDVSAHLFGDEKSIFRYSTIIEDRVLQKAKEFNKVYNSATDAETQWIESFGVNAVADFATRNGISQYHATYEMISRIEQNISNVLHMETKLILLGADDDTERLKLLYEIQSAHVAGTTIYACSPDYQTLFTNLAMVEHERWNSAHKLRGYEFGTPKDYVRKIHDCICDWKDLSPSSQFYDYRVIDTTIDLAYNETNE